MDEKIGNLDKILSMIKGIERKNLEFENYISNLNFFTRTNLLKEISFNIIKNSKIFQELNINNKNICLSKEEQKSILNNEFVEEIILKIKNYPTKKIIILREFLDNFKDISQNDKDVILQSLKDKDEAELKEEISNLIKIFKTGN